MRKRHIKNDCFTKRYTPEELKEYIERDVNNFKFKNHCKEVSKNLGIHEQVVQDVLLDNSFQVLSLIQSNVLKNKEIKINITGFFSFITSLIQFRFKHLKAVTKGRIY